MNIVTKIKSWLELKKKLAGKSIGFIPTMGNLHEGHLALCQRAKTENDVVVVSIFINPTQFNQEEDFKHYPRTPEQDYTLLQANAVDYLFYPNAKEMYPDDYQVQVTETELSAVLEGEHRLGHFNGMLTVVLKLLNLIGPTRAYFGEKDYQQFLLVKKMVSALFLPTEVVACPTIRAKDGLALSSRNTRLDAKQREKAAYFPHHLRNCKKIEEVIAELNALGFRVDYIAEKWQRRLGAVWLDHIRLIDNIPL